MDRKKVGIAIGVVVSLLCGGGIALAAWSASGSGTGTSEALTAQSLTVTAVTLGPSAASLYPGGPAGTVYYTVHNPNKYSVEITHITWGTPTSTNPTSCQNSNFSLDSSAPTTVTQVVPPSTSSDSTFSVSGVVDMSGSAGDACQGVDVNIPMTISGAQS